MAVTVLSRRIRGLVLACLLAACASDSTPESVSALLPAIKRYYESNAVEQNNTCKAPIMDGVTRSEVLSRDNGQTVVRVAYTYRDTLGRRTARRRCRGFGERTFTVSTEAGRHRVVGMTGELRSSPSLQIW